MGLVFVVLATGMVLILSVNKILFMAYGAFYTLGAYVTWYSFEELDFPYFPALICGVLATAVLGVLSYVFIFHHLQRREGGFLATLIASMGLNMVLSQGGLLVYGSQPRGIPTVFSGSVQFFGIDISANKLMLIIAGVGITALLFLVYERTRLGRSMRAVAFSAAAASLQGVNTARVAMLTLGIGTALAGIAGGILAPVYGMNPQMGSNVLWTVFLMTMLGGADSLLGAVAGGLVIGQILSFGQYYIGGTVQILLFACIGVILYFRPQGLLGRGVEIGV